MPSKPGPEGWHEFKPLSGWEVANMQDTAVVLMLDYAASDEDFDAERDTRLQLHLPPETAAQLAAALARVAEKILRQPTPPRRQ